MKVAVTLLAVLATGCLSKPSFECELAAVGAGEIDDELGSTGGVPNQGRDCGQEAVVGIGFELTRTPNGDGEKTAVNAVLRCASFSYRDGYTAGATVDRPSIGGSEMNLDPPLFAECPPGRVVVGLAAHLVGGTHLLNSLAIDCSALDAGGATVGDVERVSVVGTGTEPIDDDARCADGRALHGLDPMSGRELDRLRLRCAPMMCGPRTPGPRP